MPGPLASGAVRQTAPPSSVWSTLLTPGSSHQQLNVLNACPPLNKEDKTPDPVSPSGCHSPSTLPSLKATCTLGLSGHRHLRWALQIHSNLASEPITQFTATFLLLHPVETFRPHFIYPLGNFDYYWPPLLLEILIFLQFPTTFPSPSLGAQPLSPFEPPSRPSLISDAPGPAPRTMVLPCADNAQTSLQISRPRAAQHSHPDVTQAPHTQRVQN